MPTYRKKKQPIHHASDFGLDPLSGDDDMFRWFLLAFLFGKPIQSSVAVQTWKLFIEHKADTPWAILDMSSHALVKILHEGKYTRYQHVTARALHTCMDQLIRSYEGSIMLMLESSENEEEFSKRLQKLYGVGPKTAQIFMRETEEYFARRVE
jgi:endonuclease III